LLLNVIFAVRCSQSLFSMCELRFFLHNTDAFKCTPLLPLDTCLVASLYSLVVVWTSSLLPALTLKCFNVLSYSQTLICCSLHLSALHSIPAVSLRFGFYACLQIILLITFSALVGRQEEHPACKKTDWWGAGMVICPERGADLHMAQLMPLLVTVSCFSKIQISFILLVLAHPGSPWQRAVKWVCVLLTYDMWCTFR